MKSHRSQGRRGQDGPNKGKQPTEDVQFRIGKPVKEFGAEVTELGAEALKRQGEAEQQRSLARFKERT